jgi:hypothetical protein
MNITEVREKSKLIEIILGDSTKIDVEKLMSVIAHRQGAIYLLGQKPNSIFVKIKEDLGLEEKGEYLKNFLTFIKKK